MTIEKMSGITGINHDGLQGQMRNRTIGTEQQSPPAQRSTKQSTRIDLSPSLSHLIQDSYADIDLKKVQRLQQAITEGRYKMDAGKIADALMAAAEENDDA
ncbi:flagellar biosynthesis anti-sigma factor FlgM [Rosenbergiella australiborealis]|uniref:Negative regulator of flagellin synthesis n=1 Tax=Rosenbergiella australiborealis TaxID=1544696 RepID=A0ABS5T2Q5_9GAMM|nr:flagellar biosynthesis anti-sigma factor FlgM [Rosenbergiella australiborealis]MBT0726637.1 flagellar biosynthesis anti-sigma factor FlgM [Rosenbergiella australiborealis]